MSNALDPVGARQRYAEAANICRARNETLACAHNIRHLADIFQREGNLTEARPLYEEALELYRGHLDTKILDLANTVRPFALLNETQGNSNLALKLWEEARNLYASLRVDAGIAECDSHIHRLKHS